jgi:hypothetical protein
MRKTKYDKFREGINMDSQLSELKSLFAQVADKRAKNACHKLRDILMLGYCVFALKKPSLLNFEQKTTAEISNLKQIYGVESICSDSRLREVLDTVNPNFLRTHLGAKFQTLEQTGILRDYAFKIGAQSYLIMSCDGTQHFQKKSNVIVVVPKNIPMVQLPITIICCVQPWFIRRSARFLWQILSLLSAKMGLINRTVN